jgi:hypothetical protein
MFQTRALFLLLGLAVAEAQVNTSTLDEKIFKAQLPATPSMIITEGVPRLGGPPHGGLRPVRSPVDRCE